MNRKKGIIIGGVVIIVAAFAYLLYGGLDQNVVYFLTPKELLAKGTKAVDVPVRLGGQVKPGSVVWNDTTLSLRFTITDGTSEVAVASKGAPPQMFRDGMGVVVEGRYRADGTFKSREEIREEFDRAGIDPAQPFAASCGSGVTAAILIFAAHLIGGEGHKLYDGSWSEWCADPATPKTVGPA